MRSNNDVIKRKLIYTRFGHRGTSPRLLRPLPFTDGRHIPIRAATRSSPSPCVSTVNTRRVVNVRPYTYCVLSCVIKSSSRCRSQVSRRTIVYRIRFRATRKSTAARIRISRRFVILRIYSAPYRTV